MAMATKEAAWRAKIGVVKATHRGRTLGFWYNLAPEGVEVVTAMVGYRSGTRTSFGDQGLDRVRAATEELAELGCSAVMITGTPPFLLQGPEFEQEWCAEMEARLGRPVITPTLPHIYALKALGARRVAAATYYNDDLNQGIVRFFAHFDIDVVLLGGLQSGEPSEELYSTPLLSLDAVSYQDVYAYCKDGLVATGEDVDAIYINGSGWEAAPALRYLERDLDVPTVWAQAANVWYTYRRLLIRNETQGFGRLLEEWPPLPSL